MANVWAYDFLIILAYSSQIKRGDGKKVMRWCKLISKWFKVTDKVANSYLIMLGKATEYPRNGQKS